MKHVNKFKSYLALVIATLIVGSSCSKKTDDTPIAGNPKILSFGFYAEDNEDNLFRDYVVENVTGTAITIALPKDADKSKLVARFTTSDDVTVTVGGANQVSGSTALNFAAPVDYIVTERETNARYTVTVANAADYVWSRLGAYTEYAVGSYEMRINQNNAAPYFLFRLAVTETENQKAYVAKYENNSWSTIGKDISDGRIGTFLDLAFNDDGTLYITYPDYNQTPESAPTVKKYNGTTWSNVGTGNPIPASVSYGALSFNPSTNQPVLFNYINDRNYTIARRAAVSTFFDGTAWNTANSKIADRDYTSTAGIMKAKRVNDVVYLAIQNHATAKGYSVYTYQQNTWTTIANEVLEEGSTLTNTYDFDLDVSSEGDIYIMVSDNATGAQLTRVKKYNATTKTWSQIGDPFTLSRHFAFALAPNGTPYVIYRNDQEFPVVVSFDHDTQNWGNETVLENSQVENVFIDFSNDGTGYASFGLDNNIILHKFDVPAN